MPSVLQRATRPTIALSVLVLSSALVRSLAAQVPTRTLTTAERAFEETFTAISGLRELADGRVIVGDTREKTLRIFDPRTGVATAVGREGKGPGEWGVITRLHAMPGDSTMMADPMNNRFFVINPDGKAGATIMLPEDAPGAFGGGLLGVDARGGMIFERQRRPANPGFRAPSTGIWDILRYDRKSQRTDTLGQFARGVGEISSARVMPGGMLKQSTNLPLAPIDAAVVAGDGRIAIARGEGYRVDWIAVGGRMTRGAPAPAPQVKVNDAEKTAFLKSLVQPGQIITSGPIQSTGGAAPRGAPAGVVPIDPSELDSPDMTWPANKPPFLRSGVQLAPDGRVWVLRARAHDDLVPTYDVFDGAGKLVERVVLPKNARLVGFGKDAVYLARPDEDDLLTLERHRFK